MKVPNAFWGECVPSLMKESQRFCNKLYRSIENNIAIASGPQVIVNDVGRIAEGEELTAIEKVLKALGQEVQMQKKSLEE